MDSSPPSAPRSVQARSRTISSARQWTDTDYLVALYFIGSGRDLSRVGVCVWSSARELERRTGELDRRPSVSAVRLRRASTLYLVPDWTIRMFDRY